MNLHNLVFYSRSNLINAAKAVANCNKLGPLRAYLLSLIINSRYLEGDNVKTLDVSNFTKHIFDITSSLDNYELLIDLLVGGKTTKKNKLTEPLFGEDLSPDMALHMSLMHLTDLRVVLKQSSVNVQAWLYKEAYEFFLHYLFREYGVEETYSHHKFVKSGVLLAHAVPNAIGIIKPDDRKSYIDRYLLAEKKYYFSLHQIFVRQLKGTS